VICFTRRDDFDLHSRLPLDERDRLGHGVAIFAANLVASAGTALSLYEKWHGATSGQ